MGNCASESEPCRRPDETRKEPNNRTQVKTDNDAMMQIIVEECSHDHGNYYYDHCSHDHGNNDHHHCD